jgi:hypothetical protein
VKNINDSPSSSGARRKEQKQEQQEQRKQPKRKQKRQPQQQANRYLNVGRLRLHKIRSDPPVYLIPNFLSAQDLDKVPHLVPLSLCLSVCQPVSLSLSPSVSLTNPRHTSINNSTKENH